MEEFVHTMDNFSYKTLTDAELAEIFDDCHFKIQPRRLQLICLAFIIGQKLDNVALWLPVRSGKTITALLTAQYWKAKKILVVCPNGPAFEGWKRDIPVASSYTHKLLVGTRADRIYQLRSSDPAGVYVINYEGLKSIWGHLAEEQPCPKCKGRGFIKVSAGFCGDRQKECKKCEGTGKVGKWIVDQDAFIDNFDTVVFDEVHHCTDFGAIQSDICYELSKRSPHCVGMSADPIDKHYLEFFNIHRVIDLGQTFGKNFFAFRSTYFKELTFTNGHTGGTFKKWVLRHGAEDQLMEKVAKISISFDRSEYSTVPDNDPITIEVEPSQEFKDWQRLVAENPIVTINEFPEECDDPTIKGQKFLELSGGFIYYNKKSVHKLKANPKLDALIKLINESDGKVIVWHHHIPEAHLIEEAFTASGISFMSIRGETKADKTKVAKSFAACKSKVLLVQQSINEGWEGSCAKFMVFYTPVAGPRRRNQCEGRMKGEGQVPDYKIFDLLVKDSFDITVKNNLKKNTSFARSAMDFIKSFNR